MKRSRPRLASLHIGMQYTDAVSFARLQRSFRFVAFHHHQPPFSAPLVYSLSLDSPSLCCLPSCLRKRTNVEKSLPLPHMFARKGLKDNIVWTCVCVYVSTRCTDMTWHIKSFRTKKWHDSRNSPSFPEKPLKIIILYCFCRVSCYSWIYFRLSSVWILSLDTYKF